MSGRVSYLKGLAAEDSVVARYEAQGATILERRWRGAGGEIDLIVRLGVDVVFVEVKASATADAAAHALSERQIARLFAAAEAFLGTLPTGSLTHTRFDVALVDGAGQVTILENALIG